MDTTGEGGDTGKKPVQKEVKVGGAASQGGRKLGRERKRTPVCQSGDQTLRAEISLQLYDSSIVPARVHICSCWPCWWHSCHIGFSEQHRTPQIISLPCGISTQESSIHACEGGVVPRPSAQVGINVWCPKDHREDVQNKWSLEITMWAHSLEELCHWKKKREGCCHFTWCTTS